MPFGKRKTYLEDLFCSVLSKYKKYHSSGNLKFNNVGIFQSLKLRNLMGKILRISLKLNSTPNTLGCYELSEAKSPATRSNLFNNFEKPNPLF